MLRFRQELLPKLMRHANLYLALLLFFSVISADRRTTAPPIYGRLPDPNIQISQYIRRMLQDSKGNIWFGTNGDGVARYDGKTLTYFTRNDGFCGNTVRGMLEDKKGNVWFATSGGVCRYDGKSFQSITWDDGLGSNEVLCLLIDRKGILWVGTDAGM